MKTFLMNMGMSRLRRRAVGVATAVVMAAALAPMTAGIAQAGDSWCYANYPTHAIDTVFTPDGQTQIILYYAVNSMCAYAGMYGIPYTSEVWVDRRPPYQGMLSGVRLAGPDGHGGTDMWWDSGKEMRACGTSGKGTQIVCTRWY